MPSKIADRWEVRERVNKSQSFWSNPYEFVTQTYSKLLVKSFHLRGYEHEEIYLKLTNGGHDSLEDCEDWYTDSSDNKLLNDEYGYIQFDFLKKQGLKPTDEVLEIGCGFLRCGVRLIDFLKKGKYTGIDISASAIEEANEVVDEYGLNEKEPKLFQNEDLYFDDAKFRQQSFDVVFSYSVFTHLPPERIEQCIANMGKILNEGGTHYASYSRLDSHGYIQKNNAFGRGYSYPFGFFEELGEEYGYTVDNNEFAENPKGNNIIEFKRVNTSPD